MHFQRLALCLLFGTAWLNAANIPNVMTFSCGNVAGDVTNNNNGTWALAVTCADGATFAGTSTLVDTGAPSDLRIQGTFRDNPGGMRADSFVYSLSGYTLPPGPNVEAWHELHGVMNLGGNQGANPLASLTAAAGLLIGTKVCNTGGVSTGMINGSFNVAQQVHASCQDNPLWTRGVTLTASFDANVAANGSITLGQGQSNNFFLGVPEPSTMSLLGLGLLAAIVRRRAIFPAGLRSSLD